MSLLYIADRFTEDEGDLFSLYEGCNDTVKLFFNKLKSKMNNEGYTYVSGDFTLPPDASELHTDKYTTLVQILRIAVRYQILNRKCDLDCIDDTTWEYLRNMMLRSPRLIHRNS